jgi:hypothetical protein
MIGRSVQGLPKTIDIPGLSFIDAAKTAPRRRRRTLAAFLTGAGLIALGFGSLEAGVAAGLVNNSNSPIAFITSQVHDRFSALDGPAAEPHIVWSSVDPEIKHKRKHVALASLAAQGPTSQRQTVCVRLCDGYFFPIGPLSRAGDLPNHEATCSSLCPDAPTQLFVEPAGSNRIEDAVSPDGARYTALPVAFRNRATVDNTCSCHRRLDQAYSLMNDSTLRKGDSIMTPKGILVFRGAGRMPYAQSDFTTLANAAMPRDKRETLAAIERATLPNIHQANAAPAQPRKSEIAFAAPSLDPSKARSANKSIHFIEPLISASN